ncbi:MAG TPA: Gfo/Idh/MocA family oxidoreductase [Ktedonobacterales bacterium]|nr:Gfo/Idh/MocA family oxidoreductase [Ktedonobacterales bacterium]
MTDSWRGYGHKKLGVALIGSGFMGSVHTRAYKSLPLAFPNTVYPDVRVVADATDELAHAAARRWEIPSWTSDWRSLLDDDSIDIVDICAPPNLHREIGLAAAAAGKHVYCEKPLGVNTAETSDLCEAVHQHNVASFVGFNYRWAPATIFARQLIAAGKIGTVRNFRAAFNSDWAAADDIPWAWRFDHKTAGYGALGDVGSHVFDMARFRVGEIAHVAGYTRQVIFERPLAGASSSGTTTREVDNDDEWGALVRFEGGATGLLEGSRVATGSKTRFTFEVVGSVGSLRWDFERMNELEVYAPRQDSALDGFTRVLMGNSHPYQGAFVPQAGISIGFLETKVLEIMAFLEGISTGVAAAPTFDDGLAVARLLDQVAENNAAQ